MREKGGPDRRILDGVDVHIAFQNSVTAGGNKRNPTAGELDVWKKVLTKTAQQHGAWAHTDKATLYKREGQHSARVVKFSVPRGVIKALKGAFKDANFEVGGAASVKGMDVIGETPPALKKGTPLVVTPL